MINPYLSKRQRDILVGLLLGDGCIEVLPNGNSARLKLEYTAKQKMYIDWLHDQFHIWITKDPKQKLTHAFGKIYKKYWCTTISSTVFKTYFDLFYRDHRKIIPTTIDKLLTPIGLAVWFMDDGSTKSKESNGRLLCTHAFSENEVDLLCDVLKKKFLLEAKPRRQKDGTEIYISGHSYERLKRLMERYFVSSMRYKLL